MGGAVEMELFAITEAGLQEREVAHFGALGLYERADLQRLLRDNIKALSEDLLVVAEEFGEWEDARRRIDLLAVDKAGRLVVIELKRTDDGGHMELALFQRLVPAVTVDGLGQNVTVAGDGWTRLAGCSSHNRDEASTSVNRNVTVPDGNLAGSAALTPSIIAERAPGRRGEHLPIGRCGSSALSTGRSPPGYPPSRG
jgi:hypothetical protein